MMAMGWGADYEVTDRARRYDRELIRRLLSFLAALLVFWVTSFGNAYVLSVTANRVLYDIRTAMFRRLTELSPSFYDRETVGRTISKVTSDVSALNELLTQGLVSSIADLVTLVGVVVVLFSMSWKLALVVMIVVPALVGG